MFWNFAWACNSPPPLPTFRHSNVGLGLYKVRDWRFAGSAVIHVPLSNSRQSLLRRAVAFSHSARPPRIGKTNAAEQRPPPGPDADYSRSSSNRSLSLKLSFSPTFCCSNRHFLPQMSTKLRASAFLPLPPFPSRPPFPETRSPPSSRHSI